jgi:hypothetical protein
LELERSTPFVKDQPMPMMIRSHARLASQERE